MRYTEQPITAVVSGSELFSRFITLAKFDDKVIISNQIFGYNLFFCFTDRRGMQKNYVKSW